MNRALLLALLSAFLLVPALSPAADESAVRPASAKVPRLVAGTELIADIARDLLGAKAEILTLAPAGSCPGHHDIRATDMAFMAGADLLLLHAWQQRQPAVAGALHAAAPAHPPVYLAGTGSWLVPENQIAASKAVALVLKNLPGVDGGALDQRLRDRITRAETLSSRCLQRLKPLAGTPAVAAFMQSEFTRWMGFNVIGTYGRTEDLTPAVLAKLVRDGRQANVRLVADNLQSGAETGRPLAGELGAAHVAFSNFPGFSPAVATWEALLEYNCSLAIQALQ